MVKKSLSLALALVLCLTLSAPALAAGPIFTDVPADHWAHEQIAKAYNIGICLLYTSPSPRDVP